MSKRATAAFVFSVIGAAYQMMSSYVAVFVDRNTAPFFFTYGMYTLFLTSFIVFWSAGHILEGWKGQITWPSIILAIAVANLSTIILAYVGPNSAIFTPYGNPSAAGVSAIVPGPILVAIGGILGFSAVRQYSREHGRAVIAHA